MFVIVLYILMNGVFTEVGIRSENGQDYDKFKTLALCEAQAKKDFAEMFAGSEGKAKLVCEKR